MLVEVPGTHDAAAVRRRNLALLLQSLRAPGDAPLPRPLATDADLAARWRGQGR